MAQTIIYRLQLEGGEQIVRTQKDLADAIKLVNNERKELDTTSERYKRLTADVGALKAIQQDLNRDVREQGKIFRATNQEATGSYNQLKTELERLTIEFRQLDQAGRESTRGQEIIANLKKVKKEFNSLRAELDEGLYNNFFAAVQDGFQGFAAAMTGDIGAIATALGADGPLALGLETLGRGIEVLDELTNRVQKLKLEIGQLTDLSGQDLNQATANLLALSETFQVDENELLLAANALTDQLTGDFDESIRLIEEGFLAGANANGEFLDSIREYPAFFKELELSGGQFISVITQGVTSGVFSDKGVDLIKEFGLRIRELTPATQEALASIGITFDELSAVIAEEGIGGAFALVQEKLGELEADSQEVGLVLADVFGGPGEDAGVDFIRSLDLAQDGVTDLIDATDPLIQQQIRLLEVNKELGAAQTALVDEFGPIISQFKLFGLEILTEVLKGLVAFVNMIKAIPEFLKENQFEIAALTTALVVYNRATITATLSTLRQSAVEKASIAIKRASAIATGFLTTATKGLSAAMRANPIGVVVTALTLLVVALKAAYDRSQTLRAGLDGLTNVAKTVFSILTEAVGSFIDGFDALKEGRFRDAFNAFGEGLIKSNPIGIALTEGDRLATAFSEGYTERIEQEAEDEKLNELKQGLVALDEDQAADSGEEAGQAATEGLVRGMRKNLQQLEAEKKKIEASLAALDPESGEFDETLKKLRTVEGEILAIQKRIKEATNFDPPEIDTDPVIGSIGFIRQEIQKLEDELINQNLGETDLELKITQIAQKKDELDELEAEILAVRTEIERELDPEPLLEPLDALETQIKELDFGTANLETQVTRQIDILERQRRKRLDIAASTIKDEGKLTQAQSIINLETERAILEQRLRLATKNSDEWLAIRAEMFEKDSELAQENARKVESVQVQQLRQTASQLISGVQTLSNEIFSTRLESVQDQKDIEIALEEERLAKQLQGVEQGSEEEQAIIAESEARKAAIEKKALEEKKKVQLKQATINLALSVGSALTTQPFIPAGLIAAALATTLGLAQISKIQSTTYDKGGYTGSGKFPADRTGRKVAGVVHQDEYVVPTPVLESVEGAVLVAQLEAIRLGLPYRAPTPGYYQFGGPTESLPFSQQITEVQVNATVSLEAGEVDRIAEAVMVGSAAGTQSGTQNGLTSGLRTAERQAALESRLNV